MRNMLTSKLGKLEMNQTTLYETLSADGGANKVYS